MGKTIVIIGGGAGGMTTATQIKKKNPDFKVVLFEKSPYVSWAACPTPYYIAGELSLKSVIHYDKKYFVENRGIEVYTEHEVQKIDFKKKKIIVRGEEILGEYSYDSLVLSLGGRAITPNIKAYSSEIEGIFRLSHATDALKIKEYIQENNLKDAVIIGGGFIGLEMAEAFEKNNLDIKVIEMNEEILPFLSEKIKTPIYSKLKEKNIELLNSSELVEIKSENNKLSSVILKDGRELKADILLLSIGIKPNLDLLKKSDFNLENGKLYVNKNLETYEKDVYALGDMIYTDNTQIKEKVYAPFGDVADKQAIILAKNLAGIKAEFDGVNSSYASSFYDVRIAKTGLSLKEAIDKGYEAKSIFVRAMTEVPGFKRVNPGNMEIIYDDKSKTLLGASMTGKEAVSQFIDQFSIVLRYKIPIKDWINIDFAYSPTNSSVWNPMLLAYRKIIK